MITGCVEERDALFVGGIVQLSLLQEPPVVGAALVAHTVAKTVRNV